MHNLIHCYTDHSGEIFDAFKDVLLLRDSVDGCMPHKTSKCSTAEKNILSGGLHHSVLDEKTTVIDDEAYCTDKKEHSDDDWEILEIEAELIPSLIALQIV